jgi:succinoglycan biosynthesis protein ExoA
LGLFLIHTFLSSKKAIFARMGNISKAPLISIVIPCYNEESTIGQVLDSLYHQTYPRSQMEVIVADGRSTDRSRDIIQAYAEAHPDLRIYLLDNPNRTTPSGLNVAIAHAKGELIVRMDGHSIPPPDYVERLVALQLAGKGDNVGGICKIEPRTDTPVAKVIARAWGHPLAVGDSWYRRQDATPMYVDHVLFGTYRRETFGRLGGFNEALLTNEDYEMDARIRLAGGKVWLDPSIQVVYYPPATFRGLIRQYFRYGYWKLLMIWKYPSTLRWRQLLPPLYVLSVVGSVAIAPFWKVGAYLLMALLIPYISALVGAGILDAWRQRKGYYLWGLPVAIAIMHWAWGIGFLVRLGEVLIHGAPPSQIPRFQWSEAPQVPSEVST